ncbi:MAG TPA: hypothetical protein VKZ88_04520, partial [Fibrobacteria bacterium]|nr:hypothetical protein [Fibrobacteria bacterium]
QVTRRLLRTATEKIALDTTGLVRGPRKLLALGRERFTARGRAVRRAWRTGSETEARRLARAAVGLRRGPGKTLAVEKAVLDKAARVLRLADPLQRGYARIQLTTAATARAGTAQKNRVLTSAADVRPHESILIRFHDGSVQADVRSVSTDQEKDET